MCGIVGLLGKTAEIRESLGGRLTPMFTCMAARGPDSGGLAVFNRPLDDSIRRYSVYSPDRNQDWDGLGQLLHNHLSSDSLSTDKASKISDFQIRAIENHATIIGNFDTLDLTEEISRFCPALRILSVGRSIEVYKDVGEPAEIARRFRFDSLSGTHCVGHTRMATESAVTPAHSHPFTGGEDFCLVHNGSLSNPYMLRRKLEREGLRFETDNDTEAACRYIQWKLAIGATLEEALHEAFVELDGFYTFLMATHDQLTLVRDAFACKPAVVAETEDYVAVASEFRALAHLPNVSDANIFEPEPEEIYSWPV